jgi:hypothetical protein
MLLKNLEDFNVPGTKETIRKGAVGSYSGQKVAFYPTDIEGLPENEQAIYDKKILDSMKYSFVCREST